MNLLMNIHVVNPLTAGDRVTSRGPGQPSPLHSMARFCVVGYLLLQFHTDIPKTTNGFFLVQIWASSF